MKPQEAFVAPESDYYIYSPSRLALDTFLYPMQCGSYSYEPGYAIHRDSFDSFLLMYVQRGSMDLAWDGRQQSVTAGYFVLLDCYREHSYSTQVGWDCLWCHFDGIWARPYYQAVVSRLGNVFSLPDSSPALPKLSSILKVFSTGSIVREALLSKYLTDILTEFLLFTPTQTDSGYSHSSMAEETITYINEHFREDISIEALAARVGSSPYHFIRIFKAETGFTPHAYLIATRIATARYLLKNTTLPIKDICFQSGFSCESVFCTAFKRHQGMTPAAYRTWSNENQ